MSEMRPSRPFPSLETLLKSGPRSPSGDPDGEVDGIFFDVIQKIDFPISNSPTRWTSDPNIPRR